MRSTTEPDNNLPTECWCGTPHILVGHYVTNGTISGRVIGLCHINNKLAYSIVRLPNGKAVRDPYVKPVASITFGKPNT